MKLIMSGKPVREEYFAEDGSPTMRFWIQLGSKRCFQVEEALFLDISVEGVFLFRHLIDFVARGPSRIDSLKITGPSKYKKKSKYRMKNGRLSRVMKKKEIDRVGMKRVK
jgi:hypothetical protein